MTAPRDDLQPGRTALAASTDRLFSALEEALDLPAARREEHLRARLGDDSALFDEALATLRCAESDPSLPGFHDGDLVGREAGKYPLLEVLGRGAMATVYRSRQPETERAVAVKLMVVPRGLDRTLALRHRRELVSSARLDHPNVVRVLDAGYDEDLAAHYAVLELVAGGRSLRDFDGDARAAARVVETVCRALQHAHDEGIVHRDVKPGNVLLTPQGTPKLTDFGIALDERFAAERLTFTGELAGTPHYMSPEQVRRVDAPIDHRTDVYSAGAVLYELLAHAPPHDGASSIEVFTKILDEVPRKLGADVPRDLATICAKALRKDPGERYPTARAMANDLARFLEGEPILARPEPLRRRAMRLARRHPAIVGALCATAVLVPIYFAVKPFEYAGSQLEQEHINLYWRVSDYLGQRLPDEPTYAHDAEGDAPAAADNEAAEPDAARVAGNEAGGTDGAPADANSR